MLSLRATGLTKTKKMYVDADAMKKKLRENLSKPVYYPSWGPFNTKLMGSIVY